MHRQIVHCDDVAGSERWDKALFHLGKKHRSVHGTLKHKRCSYPAQPQTSYEGDRFPMSMWGVANQSLTAGTAAIKPHHLGMRAGFVDKHQSCGVKHALLSHPAAACASHLDALLFCRVPTSSVPGMSGCGFRRMRTVIPIDCGQRFRSIADSVPVIANSSLRIPTKPPRRSEMMSPGVPR